MIIYRNGPERRQIWASADGQGHSPWANNTWTSTEGGGNGEYRRLIANNTLNTN